MTEEGGDFDIFSANGGISAGEGPKIYLSDHPIAEICDLDNYCRVNPQGLVTGAGIAALVTLPGQDPTKSNATLVAPHGAVDAGAAGIRVAGNLNVIALKVLNAYNIQVGGTALGVPTAATVDVGGLTAANSASAAVTQIANQINNQPPPPPPLVPAIVTVRFVDFGDQ